MIRTLKRLTSNLAPPNSFLHRVGVLAGGTALGQGLVVIASPAITRLYSPEDFGTLAVFAAVLAILTSVVSFRYELAIPLPDSERDATAVRALALLIVTLVTAFALVAFHFYHDAISIFLNSPRLSPLLALVPVALLFSGSYRVLTYWAIRQGEFERIAKTKLWQGAGSVLTQLALGVTSAGPLGLVLGQVAGEAAGAVSLARRKPHSSVRNRGPIPLRRLLEVGRRYWRFPVFSTWSGLAGIASTQVPTFILTSYFGDTITGLYALGLRLLQSPLKLLGTSIGQVFFSQATDAFRQGTLRLLILSVLTNVARISIPALAIFGLSAPELFSFLFGEPWRTAGLIAQWFTPWLILELVTASLSTIPSLLGRQRTEATFHVTLLVARLGALSIGGSTESPTLALALFATVSAVGWLLFLVWNLHAAGILIRESLEVLLRCALRSAHFLVPVTIGKVLGTVMAADAFVLVGAILSITYTSLWTLRFVSGWASPGR